VLCQSSELIVSISATASAFRHGDETIWQQEKQRVCYTPLGWGVNTPQFSYTTTPPLYPDTPSLIAHRGVLNVTYTFVNISNCNVMFTVESYSGLYTRESCPFPNIRPFGAKYTVAANWHSHRGKIFFHTKPNS